MSSRVRMTISIGPMLDRLRPHPHRGVVIAAGAVPLAIAAVVIDLRMTQWSLGPRFAVVALIFLAARTAERRSRRGRDDGSGFGAGGGYGSGDGSATGGDGFQGGGGSFGGGGADGGWGDGGGDGGGGGGGGGD